MCKNEESRTITISEEQIKIDTAELDDFISEKISADTGFCHLGFTYEIKVTALLDTSD